jgi:class 3 adenylate cyclase
MSFKDDLEAEAKAIFSSAWEVQQTESVPAPEDLKLNTNHAKDLTTATVLYADLDGSTNMVDNEGWQVSAEVYKAYLRCAAQIIRKENGIITAYDGDRIMAIFTGGQKNTNAVKAALKINYAVEEIIRPAFKSVYSTNSLAIKHVVGVDTSQLRTARIGVRGDNDLVWIGRAANYAAKLTDLSERPIWITNSVYNMILDEAKFSNGTNMWTKRLWTKMNNMEIYFTAYRWVI